MMKSEDVTLPKALVFSMLGPLPSQMQSTVFPFWACCLWLELSAGEGMQAKISRTSCFAGNLSFTSDLKSV